MEKGSLNFQHTLGKGFAGKSPTQAAREKERYLGEDVAIKTHVKPLTVLIQKDKA